MSRLIDADELMEEIRSYRMTVTGLRAGKGVLNECMIHFSEGILKIIDEQSTVNDWIPCSVRLPEDYDNRFYMCIVENHEEDLPMFLQYVEDCGFGYWYDIYDKHTLGFVDSEFKTNEELGYEKVIAWQPLPKPYHPDKCHGCFGAANNDCRFCEDDGK